MPSAAALPLQAAGIGTLYTRLGENLEDLAAAEEVAAHYLEAIDKIVAAGITGEISVKPTQLGLDHDAERVPRPTSSGSPSTPPPPARTCGSTWRAAPTPRRRSPCTSGCARSSRGPGSASRRTCAARPADIERLRPLDPAIRLVKGAYDEKAAIAYTRQARSVDANYVGLAVAVPPGRPRPADPARPRDARRGAHRADRRAGRRRPASGATAFEVEMLYGIRTEEQFRLAKAGYRVQTLIAYGEPGIRGTCVDSRSARRTCGSPSAAAARERAGGHPR